jgi:hypothetical protein
MRVLLIGLYTVLATFSFFLFSDPSLALRCGTKLVSEGDTKAEVIYKCGEPGQVESWDEERIMRDHRVSAYQDRYSGYLFYREPFLVKEHVRIEEWTYNFGSSRLLRYLRFENGILKFIATGGYGY